MTRRQLKNDLRKAATAMDHAIKARDNLMVKAVSEGMTLREIAPLVGLTFSRVGQIVRAKHDH